MFKKLIFGPLDYSFIAFHMLNDTKYNKNRVYLIMAILQYTYKNA